MNVAILRFLGTNCEFDIQYALEQEGAKTEFVWFKEQELPDSTSLVIIPGGFSYGDYLRSGAIARFAPVMQAVSKFAKKGGRVVGICNGFQILVESGLLTGVLMRNQNLHFISKVLPLRVCSTDNPFLQFYKKDEIIRIPVAHADGCYYTSHEEYKKLRDNGQILLTYEENLNGSLGAIAGICNKEKNVFGLMPHPERAIHQNIGGSDGLAMIKGFMC
ncbi:phosphoribosylformylglycinamidine synthase I [Helicobacter monodelphidis]|uniref:phosphoribosylformylglycinamidine synthase subunit PurQ n=1 Tax=Helicobacter sp. 15-1451 TaxID=2004995 RepID=UPI000DCCA71C|nr:phosphoribosylformylglycinamidine synthase subunit PurQ [Helicobacter sp. 15-1451]RAX56883.1 phosphoribosylformylglycinamidine synthase I [Helicobacter sp. 15-1451]